jgi:hypothetical protein
MDVIGTTCQHNTRLVNVFNLAKEKHVQTMLNENRFNKVK